MWKYITGGIVACSVTYGFVKYFSRVYCRCNNRLDGLVVVVTGASSGIGKELVFQLAQRGATLVLACRNVEKGNNVKNEILQERYNIHTRILVKELDLSSFASVVKFSASLRQEFQEIYALVNNAEEFYHPHSITEDGYEITLQTNYLGPFILTHNLLELLKNADHSRIVNVASLAHRFVNLYDLKAITTSQTEFRPHLTAYGVSKLALVLFTRYLQKKLSNTNVIVNCADPGYVEANTFCYNFSTRNKLFYWIQWPFRYLLGKTPNQGAQTLFHCLLTSNRSTGQYYYDCRLTLPSRFVNDKLAQEYYELTLQILDNKFNTESQC